MSQDKEHDKNFLSRWSQRKREAKLPEIDRAVVEADGAAEAKPAPTFEVASDQEFDFSSLPKLEEITETTDITGFLRKGVPESLRNAVLRKSWALDPAIRNYVNPALDYAYDWNTPGGVPGSSELAAGTDIAKMVLQIMGIDPVSSGSHEFDAEPHGKANDGAGANPEADAPQNAPPELPHQQMRLSVSTAGSPYVSASLESEHAQLENPPSAQCGENSASQQEVRRHGTAKPKV